MVTSPAMSAPRSSTRFTSSASESCSSAPPWKTGEPGASPLDGRLLMLHEPIGRPGARERDGHTLRLMTVDELMQRPDQRGLLGLGQEQCGVQDNGKVVFRRGQRQRAHLDGVGPQLVEYGAGQVARDAADFLAQQIGAFAGEQV